MHMEIEIENSLIDKLRAEIIAFYVLSQDDPHFLWNLLNY